MTTSSHNRPSETTRPEAKNWFEVSNQLSAVATLKFGDWIDAQLRALEEAQKRFITNRSVAKSLRR